MALKRYELPYGKTKQEIFLPEERVLEVLEAPMARQMKSVGEMVEEALAHPIGGEKLAELVKPGDKVALIVSDITRVWSKTAAYLPYVVAELNRIGIPDQDIYAIVATGTHRSNTAAEKADIVGADLARRIPLYDHDPSPAGNVYLGTTSRGTPVYVDKRAVAADKVILTGGITPHLFAGFGGGRKSVMPGLSSAVSINHNHLLALGDQVGSGLNPATCMTAIDGNRVNEDMEEVTSFLNPCFLVNSIMDAEGNFYRIVAGNWRKAWREGTRLVQKQQGVPARGQSEVVFTTPGGYPKDINLYQGMKCYAPASMVAKKGGIIIVALECPDMMEPPVFFDSFRFNSVSEMELALRQAFTIPFYIAFFMSSLAQYYTIIMVTEKVNFAAAKKTGAFPVASVTEAWQLAQNKLAEQGKKDYSITLIPYGVDTIPLLS